MMTVKTIAWRRAGACVLTMLMAAAPLAAEAGQNGRRAASGGSDVRAVLEFEGDWSNQLTQLTSTPVVPAVCQTASYVAGPNEVAVINFDGEVAPAGSVSLNLAILRAAVSKDWGAFSTLPGFPSRQELGALAHVSMARRVVLDEGSTYVFGAAFSVLSPITTALGECRGTVTIVRIDP